MTTDDSNRLNAICEALIITEGLNLLISHINSNNVTLNYQIAQTLEYVQRIYYKYSQLAQATLTPEMKNIFSEQPATDYKTLQRQQAEYFINNNKN